MRLQWFKPLPGETRRGLKGKYAQRFSLHIFAGMSRRGPTPIIIFEGKFDKIGFENILETSLIPFIQQIILITTYFIWITLQFIEFLNQQIFS